MRLEKGADVFAASGEKIGSVSRIVIDARTRDVTDLVVETGALFNKAEKVIPAGLVDAQADERIVLRQTNQSIEDFLDYQTTHYVPVEDAGAPFEHVEANYWYPPVNFQMEMSRAGLISTSVPDQVARTESSIPEGRLVISEGARVVSADDRHVGNVEQVITGADNALSHFVVGKGFLLREQKLVPSSWVTGIDDEQVRLSVVARQFDRLPDYHPD